MSIEDSGFESEDQIFYSDAESELSFEILQIENIGHYNNNLQLAFMQNNLPIEINPLQLQDHQDILQISEDLDQLLDVMENQAMENQVVESQAMQNPVEQHENLMRDLETPVGCTEEMCTTRGCPCEEMKWGTKDPHNYSAISEDFEKLCDNIETACASEHQRTSTPIPRTMDQGCQTEPQDGDDERIYDGEMSLIHFSNEQVGRMLQKHDKFREETLVREQAMREKYEETYEKCQEYYNETQALLQENNNMKVMHVEQLITFDALVRTKDLELRAARKIIEDNITKSQKHAEEMHNMKIRMQKLQDENMRQRNAHEREKRLGQRRTNEFYNSERRIRAQNPEGRLRFNNMPQMLNEEASTSRMNGFSFQRQESEATTSSIFRFGKQN
jgi:hypothetical protein